MSLEILAAPAGAELAAVKELWTEYWHSLGFSPDFQNFGQELRSLPGEYSPPSGCLLLVRTEGQPAGTAACRKLTADSCEIKRLYVRPAYRKAGLARALIVQLMRQAKRVGYRQIYCDTMPEMLSALNLYRSLGFREVDVYSSRPTSGATYLRLDL